MVKVTGKIKYASGCGKKGYFKVNETFRTKRAADSFVRSINKGSKTDKVAVTSYRKPIVQSSNTFGFRVPKMRFGGF